MPVGSLILKVLEKVIDLVNVVVNFFKVSNKYIRATPVDVVPESLHFNVVFTL